MGPSLIWSQPCSTNLANTDLRKKHLFAWYKQESYGVMKKTQTASIPILPLLQNSWLGGTAAVHHVSLSED